MHPLIGPFALHLTDRHNIRYIGFAVLPRHIYDSSIGTMVFGTLEFFQSYMNAAGIINFMIILCVYSSITKVWIKALRSVYLIHFIKSCIKLQFATTVPRILIKSNISFSQMNGTWTEKLGLYRILLVHNGHSNECFAKLLWPVTG